jgi:hypothetical protein
MVLVVFQLCCFNGFSFLSKILSFIWVTVRRDLKIQVPRQAWPGHRRRFCGVYTSNKPLLYSHPLQYKINCSISLFWLEYDLILTPQTVFPNNGHKYLSSGVLKQYFTKINCHNALNSTKQLPLVECTVQIREIRSKFSWRFAIVQQQWHLL